MKYIKKRLCDVEFGTNFEIWGHAYTVLDGDEKGVFVLEADTICEMPFRENESDYEFVISFREEEVNYKVAPNDFRDSSVKAYLEGAYTEGLVRAGAKLDEDILLMELDLKCTLGQREYGTVKVYAGLLTLEQYGKYYDIIPRIGKPYWLATPWKTPSHSTSTNFTYNVWSVISDSNYNYRKYDNIFGVRPTLLLDPSLLVSVECDGKEESDDTIARSKNLDMWNEYLNYLIKWSVTHANDEDYIGDYPLSYYDDWDKE